MLVAALFHMVYGVSWTQFRKDLFHEIQEDNVSNGAAALAYYLMLSIFPAMLAFLSLLPFLPIPDLDTQIMQLLRQLLPGETAQVFTDTVQGVVNQKRGGLLSVGLFLAIWAASNGMFAIMQQLNITYDVKEGRPFWKSRLTALWLTLFFGALIVVSFGLIMVGGKLQEWLSNSIGGGRVFAVVFNLVRWAIIATAILLTFAVTYYKGPDVKQRFRFVTPGSVFGTIFLVAASLAFKLYAENFGKYNATYGSIGAVIALMLWLNIIGLVILLGSEINALIEHYSPEGKNKGEKLPPAESSRAA